MEAFEEILKDQSPKIYYFLRRMGLEHESADEIVQDVFILLWRDLTNGHGLDSVNLRIYRHAIKKSLTFLNKITKTPPGDSRVTDKLIFVLKQHEGFDFGDISEMLNWSVIDVRDSFISTLSTRLST